MSFQDLAHVRFDGPKSITECNALHSPVYVIKMKFFNLMCLHVSVKEARFLKGLSVFASKSKIYGRVEDNFWLFVY